MIFVALAWVAWWAAATTGLQRGIADWLDTQRAQGVEVSVDDISRAGFPLRIAARVDGITVVDPLTTLRAPQVTISTPFYWPGHARVAASAPAALETIRGAAVIDWSLAQGNLRLRPNNALQLESMQAQGQNISVDLVEGRILGIADLRVRVDQALTPEVYNITLSGAELTPGSIIRQALRLPAEWPEAFDTFAAQMTVGFDRPWDRSILGQSRPQPRKIEITQAEAVWADLNLSLTADLDVRDGVPSGIVRLRVANWKQMLDLATTGGALSEDARPQIESGLRLLSGLSGGGDTIDLEITMEQGRMRIGFIPLGDAPRIVIP
ncbi:MAG: DUF2125 domain-containing protein [Sulfitobacter sp.]